MGDLNCPIGCTEGQAGIENQKKMPNGDFIRLLVSHPMWSMAKVRNILRDPAITKEHPFPKEAETLWVCERNVPNIGATLLNYTT